MKKNILKKSQKNIKKSHKILKYLKKSQNISKCLKMYLMLFFKRGFARLGSVLHIFLDHRKSQKISKTSQKKQKISKTSFKFAGKKQKNKKKHEKTE